MNEKSVISKVVMKEPKSWLTKARVRYIQGSLNEQNLKGISLESQLYYKNLEEWLRNVLKLRPLKCTFKVEISN